jgi:hypothetical protein
MSEETERALRWERARQKHDGALVAAGMLPRWLRRRAGRPLRYACLTPPGPLTRLGTGVLLLAYLLWRRAAGGVDLPLVLAALGVAALCLLLSTNRASVTEAGLSFDIAGVRKVSSFGFVPLHAMRDVVSGPRPADWPRGPSHGAPWPGHGRVHLRYEDARGDLRARSAWVRDPAGYAETVLGGRSKRRLS